MNPVRYIVFFLLLGMMAGQVAIAQDVNQLRLARAAQLTREGEELISKGEKLLSRLPENNQLTEAEARAQEEARRYIADGRAKVSLGNKLRAETQAQIDYERKNELAMVEAEYQFLAKQEDFSLAVIRESRALLDNLWRRNYQSIYFNQCYVDTGSGWIASQPASDVLIKALLEADATKFTVSTAPELNILIEDGQAFLTAQNDLNFGSRDNAALVYAEIIHVVGASEFMFALRAIDVPSRQILHNQVYICPLDAVLAVKLGLATPSKTPSVPPLSNAALLRDVTGFIERMGIRGSRFTFTTGIKGGAVFPQSRTLPLFIKTMFFNETLLPVAETDFLCQVLKQPDGHYVSEAYPENAQWIIQIHLDEKGAYNGAVLLGANSNNDVEVQVGPIETHRTIP